MALWRQVRAFVRAFRAAGRDGRSEHLRPDNSLARTLKDSTHVRGGRMGLARASTERQHEIVAKGHKSYVESFDDS